MNRERLVRIENSASNQTPLSNRVTNLITSGMSGGANRLTRPHNGSGSKNSTPRPSLVYVENTPTPLLLNRLRKKTAYYDDGEESETNQATASTKRIAPKVRVIPNTPAPFHEKGLPNVTRRFKKLLSINDLMNEGELMDEESTESRRIQKSNKILSKGACLFKPKAVLEKINSNTARKSDLNDRRGCDLSYESLQRIQRKNLKNPLVARLSDVERMQLMEISDSSKRQMSNASIELLESIAEQDVNNSEKIASSPILVKSMPRLQQGQKKPENSSITPGRLLRTTTYTINFTPTMKHEFDCEDSFTRVTKQTFDFTGNTQYEQTTCFTRGEKRNEMEFSESELDRILFEGLNLESVKNESKLEKMFGGNLFLDKTRRNAIRKMKKRSVSAGHKKRSSVSPRNKKNRSSSASQKLFPAQVKRLMYFFQLDLKQNQFQLMNKIVKELNKTPVKDINTNQTQLISCLVNKKYEFKTTHLIIDFNRVFDPVHIKQTLNLNKKCLLLLATLNECKIIRYEWLSHSWQNSQWLEETEYLLESYIESDLDDYDEEDDFDVKLIRFINNLQEKKFSQFFSKYKNVYVIPELEYESGDETELQNASQTSNRNMLDMTLNIFKSKNTTFDYLSEILTKCGCHLTSRPQQAELIFAIDRTHDFSIDRSKHEDEIEKESQYFIEKTNELKNEVRKKGGVRVISSDWILESLLKGELLNLEIFEVLTLEKTS